MKTETRNVLIDGTPSTQPAPGAQEVPQQRLPTKRPQVGAALAHISGAATEQAQAARKNLRSDAFRYGESAPGAAGGASSATSLLQAAAAVHDVDALRELIANLGASAKASATSTAGVSLEQQCKALEKAAKSVVGWRSWNDQVAGLRELRFALSEMPSEVEGTPLGTVIDTAHEKVIGSRMTRLASQIHSAQDLKDVLEPLVAETEDTHLWPDPLRELAHASFLEAAVDRFKTFSADEQVQGHPILSDAINSLPPWMAYGAAEKLEQLEADLLPPEVKASFDKSERLAKAAETVQDLAGLHALLSQPGIAGPVVPDDTLGLVRMEHDGNLGLPALPRPEPLTELAARVGSFTPAEANRQAFSAIFEKADGIEPPRWRIGTLKELAAAAGRLGDTEREQAYRRVLTSAGTLRENRQISSEQHALVLVALQEAIARHAETGAGPAEQSALVELRQANNTLPPGFQLTRAQLTPAA